MPSLIRPKYIAGETRYGSGYNKIQLRRQITSPTCMEFRELLTLSHAEPISSGEPQLVPLLNQPVSWYQGLAKLLLSRYPENHRYYSSADGKIQYVIVLHPKLPGTAMMLSCDVLADKAVSVGFLIGHDVLNGLCCTRSIIFISFKTGAK